MAMCGPKFLEKNPPELVLDTTYWSWLATGCVSEAMHAVLVDQTARYLLSMFSHSGLRACGLRGQNWGQSISRLALVNALTPDGERLL